MLTLIAVVFHYIHNTSQCTVVTSENSLDGIMRVRLSILNLKKRSECFGKQDKTIKQLIKLEMTNNSFKLEVELTA